MNELLRRLFAAAHEDGMLGGAAAIGMAWILAWVPGSISAQEQCPTPRNLCPDPGVCFMTEAAEQAWADENSCTFITVEMLGEVNPSGSDAGHGDIVGPLNKYARQYGVNTPSEIAHFLSQVAHESNLDPYREESLSYSAGRMRQVFGCRGGQSNFDPAAGDCTAGRSRPKLWTQEASYARNPENLGNYVYANRLGNGNEASGDGYRYRGRGMIMITGRNNYQAFQDSYNAMNPDDQRDFMLDPDLIADDPKYSLASAFHWWDGNNMNRLAEGGTVCEVTCRINGGTNGYADRRHRYNNVACLLGVEEQTGACPGC